MLSSLVPIPYTQLQVYRQRENFLVASPSAGTPQPLTADRLNKGEIARRQIERSSFYFYCRPHVNRIRRKGLTGCLMASTYFYVLVARLDFAQKYSHTHTHVHVRKQPYTYLCVYAPRRNLHLTNDTPTRSSFIWGKVSEFSRNVFFSNVRLFLLFSDINSFRYG